MRNMVWNLGLISYSKERKKEKHTLNPAILQAEILFFIFSFQCHSLLCSFCLLPIFRWTAEMLKFKPHEYTSYKTITKTVLIQYLPTYPSYIKAKPSDCLTQRRLPCKYDWNSAQKWVSVAGAGPQDCCPQPRCARVPWTQFPADVPAQGTKNHPLKTAENTGCDVKGVDLLQLAKRQHYLPTAYRKGSWESILDHTGLYHGEG